MISPEEALRRIILLSARPSDIAPGPQSIGNEYMAGYYAGVLDAYKVAAILAQEGLS